MGKATIQSKSGANYTVKLEYDKRSYNNQVITMENMITELTAKIAAETKPVEKNILKLQKLSIEKKLDELEKLNDDNGTEIITAWCADYTKNLSGSVGTIEVPGENTFVNVQPGYKGNAVYKESRDGRLVKTNILSPECAYYNIAMLPGFQKWKPTYRYATIDSLDRGNNKANITLKDATSSQQSLNVNQGSSLSSVPVKYMECNARAFQVGDSVLVRFNGKKYSGPEVIGFESDPKACMSVNYILIGHRKSTIVGERQDEMPEHEIFWVYDLEKDKIATVYTDETLTTKVEFPCTLADLAYFFSLADRKMYSSTGTKVYRHNTLFDDSPINDTDTETIVCGSTTFTNTFTHSSTYEATPTGYIRDTQALVDMPWYHGVCAIRTNYGGQEFYYVMGLDHTAQHIEEGTSRPYPQGYLYHTTADYVHDFYLNMPWGRAEGVLKSEYIYDWHWSGSNFCISLDGHQFAYNPWAEGQASVFLEGRMGFSDNVFVGIGSISGWEGVKDPVTCANASDDPAITNWNAVNDIAIYYEYDPDDPSINVNLDNLCIEKATSHKGLNDILKEIIQWCKDNGGGGVWDPIHSWQWKLDEGQVLDVYVAREPIEY